MASTPVGGGPNNNAARAGEAAGQTYGRAYADGAARGARQNIERFADVFKQHRDQIGQQYQSVSRQIREEWENQRSFGGYTARYLELVQHRRGLRKDWDRYQHYTERVGELESRGRRFESMPEAFNYVKNEPQIQKEALESHKQILREQAVLERQSRKQKIKEDLTEQREARKQARLAEQRDMFMVTRNAYLLQHAFANVTGAGPGIPVLGDAGSAAINSGMTARMFGMGWGASAAMAGVGALASATSSMYRTGVEGYAIDEDMRARLAQMVGLKEANRIIDGGRNAGFLNSEIMNNALPLSAQTGDVRALHPLLRASHSYGVGGEAVQMLGAIEKSGGDSGNGEIIKDAIAAGMVSGLKQGRLHEMLIGIAEFVKRASLGVEMNADQARVVAGLAASLRSGGFSGEQAFRALGFMDNTFRGNSGSPLGASLGFVTALRNPLSGGSYWGARKIQDRGLGYSPEAMKQMLDSLSGMSGGNNDIFEALISSATGLNPVAAEKMRVSYQKGGSLDDQLNEMKRRKGEQDDQFNELVKSNNLLRGIHNNIEIISHNLGVRNAGTGFLELKKPFTDLMRDATDVGSSTDGPYSSPDNAEAMQTVRALDFGNSDYVNGGWATLVAAQEAVRARGGSAESKREELAALDEAMETLYDPASHDGKPTSATALRFLRALTSIDQDTMHKVVTGEAAPPVHVFVSIDPALSGVVATATARSAPTQVHQPRRKEKH